MRTAVPSLVIPADDSVPACLCGQESAVVLLGGQGGDYRALVHADDTELVAPYHWMAMPDSATVYVKRQWRKDGVRSRQFMHVLLVGGSTQVDHVNLNGLDNRRCNLRPATQHENCRNRGKRPGTLSSFKGVTRNYGKWIAAIHWRDAGLRHRRHLGCFEDEIEAAKAYDRAAVELFGEFARTNEMMGLL